MREPITGLQGYTPVVLECVCAHTQTAVTLQIIFLEKYYLPCEITENIK